MKMLPMTVICDEKWPFYVLFEDGTFPANCQIPETLYEEYKKAMQEFHRFQDILKEYYVHED